MTSMVTSPYIFEYNKNFLTPPVSFARSKMYELPSFRIRQIVWVTTANIGYLYMYSELSPAKLAYARPLESTTAVSYTHLTLPTNREV